MNKKLRPKKLRIKEGFYHIDVRVHRVFGINVNLPNDDPLNDMGYVAREKGVPYIQYYDGSKMEVRPIEQCTRMGQDYEQMPFELLVKTPAPKVRERISMLEKASAFFKTRSS